MSPPRRALTDDEARRARELYSTGEYTQPELAERFNVSTSTMCALLRGEKYTDVDGPTFPQGLVTPDTRGRRSLTASQARRLREDYASGQYTQAELAARAGVTVSTVVPLLRGETYSDVGGPLLDKDYTAPAPGPLNADLVREVRQMYATGDHSRTEICEHFGLSPTPLSNLLRGITYPDAGGPLTSGHGKRALTNAQARQARRLYADGAYSQAALARRFDVTPQVMNAILHGRSYKDVGGPIVGEADS